MNTFVLDNGLRVVHSRHDRTAMVAVNVLYNTGARDERPDRTGLAHLFEHVMFGARNIKRVNVIYTPSGSLRRALKSALTSRSLKFELVKPKDQAEEGGEA